MRAAIDLPPVTAAPERAGIPPGPEPGQASAMAGPVCWMIERSFHRASRISPAELRRTSATCQDLWLRIAGLG
jgi:TetR/AcrR family transcriptional regulator, ethionamide resistance regulator